MKRLSIFIFTIILQSAVICLDTFAQLQPAPKFAGKVQKAIVSLNAYDKQGDLIHSGTAFYIGENGEAMADYAILKGASKATVIDMNGKQADVDCILGADDTYSVVRFRVNTKGNAILNAVSSSHPVGNVVYALNFSKQKQGSCPQSSVESASPINEKYSYMTLANDMGDAYVGSPLFNENGELVGILQSAIGGKSYGLDIRYREELTIKAIAGKSASLALSSINIPKGLPDTYEESLVYTYLKSRNAGNDEYMDIMNRFVAAYPKSAEPYYRRSVPLTDLCRFDEADADLKMYLSLSDDKSAANYNVASAILNKLTYLPEPKYEPWTYDLALEHAQKAIELLSDSINPTYHALKAKILMGKQDYDGAISVYDYLLKNDTPSPAYHYAISMAKEAKGDSLSEVIAAMDSAIAMFGDPLPGDAAGYVLRRGKLLAQDGKFRKAVVDYNQYSYLMNSKVNDMFYYDKCLIEMDAHLYQQALEDIISAISMAPNKVDYHIQQAGMYLRFGQNDDCIASCQKALQLDNQIPDTYRIMGYAQIQKGDNALGKQNLQKAVSMGDETAKEILEKYVK